MVDSRFASFEVPDEIVFLFPLIADLLAVFVALVEAIDEVRDEFEAERGLGGFFSSFSRISGSLGVVGVLLGRWKPKPHFGFTILDSLAAPLSEFLGAPATFRFGKRLIVRDFLLVGICGGFIFVMACSLLVSRGCCSVDGWAFSFSSLNLESV